jgi:hypothetical protein
MQELYSHLANHFLLSACSGARSASISGWVGMIRIAFAAIGQAWKRLVVLENAREQS